MAKRENFTAGRIEAFTCPPGKQQAIFWDGKTPGLGVRVTSGGTKSYVFETKLQGKTLRITIGDTKTWPVKKAQDEATRLKTLTDQGTDPRQIDADKKAAAKAAQESKKHQEATVGEIWAAYTEERKHKWSARHLADHVAMCKPDYPLANLMAGRLSDLDADTVKAWLKVEAARRPTQAALAFRLLRAFVRWAADQKELKEHIHADACNTRMSKDTLPKSKVKDDCLQREQLPAWFAAIRAIGNPVISAFLQCLLLVGSRREELAAVKWQDVDFQWKAITIHDKVEGERTIPLTPFVASLLAALPRRKDSEGNPSPWVFSSPTSASGRLMEPSIQHRRVTTSAGIEGLSLHGLRRSFGTLSEWCEVPVGVVAQIQGHKPSAIAEKHYRRRPLDLLRMWHEKIEAWILEQAGVTFQAAEQPGALRAVK
jgi:integrase